MEPKRPGQTPEAELTQSDAETAARTRPADGGADVAADADAARAAARDAHDATVEMSKRGFGSHKGTEAD